MLPAHLDKSTLPCAQNHTGVRDNGRDREVSPTRRTIPKQDRRTGCITLGASRQSVNLQISTVKQSLRQELPENPHFLGGSHYAKGQSVSLVSCVSSLPGHRDNRATHPTGHRDIRLECAGRQHPLRIEPSAKAGTVCFIRATEPEASRMRFDENMEE